MKNVGTCTMSVERKKNRVLKVCGISPPITWPYHSCTAGVGITVVGLERPRVGFSGRRGGGWIRGGTSARRSDDEFAVLKDVASKHVGMLDAIEHCRHRGV